MATIEHLPPTQQLALREALRAPPLVLRRDGYAAEADGGSTRHPIRTVRALVRAGLLAEDGSSVRLTDAGRAVAEGRDHG